MICFDPVAQLVEQWPFKPLVVSSSLTRVTEKKPLISLKALDKLRGLFSFPFYQLIA